MVLASMGHIRDLPKSKMGIAIEKDFAPTYEISPDKKKVVKQLKDELKKAEELWIATDEDREGEAIGWHLLSALKVDEKKTPTHRIVFHEITETAIRGALKEPRQIDQNTVNAQQARRVLDRLVGYELSPLLWKKIQYGLSAGRVQSVAVRLIVDREREILAFKSEEYWSITGQFWNKDEKSFIAELRKHKDEKLKIENGEQSDKILEDLKGAEYKVVKIEKKETKRNPAPPFITSTLQQEASRKLGFSVKKTMMVAQQLYEGLDTGDGETGLITYMRTDSVNLSDLALKDAKTVIEKEYGKEYTLPEPRKFKGRKGAQEAHEAVRPVNLALKPAEAEGFLSADQAKLYELIWKRTLACQMAQAVLDKVAADIEANKYTFRANGQTIKFAGFMKVYLEGHDKEEDEKDDKESILPVLSEGDDVENERLIPEQHFTKPPARYTEATLVKKLEAEGIGRPSTYAPTIGTIMARDYIEKDGKALMPTDLALLVTDLLVENFPRVVDYKFTANMEDTLDKVEEGKEDWVPAVKAFYEPFHKLIEEKTETLKKEEVLDGGTLGVDPESGKDIIMRHGRFGPYIQVGEWSEEDRKAKVNVPKRASIPKGMTTETITLEHALELLKFPRELGTTDTGDPVSINQGPYGMYIKVGKKNSSLPEDANPLKMTIEEALKVAKEADKKKAEMNKPMAELGKDPVSEGEILIKNGRFGPYITDGKTNVSLGKKDPKDITFEIAVELLEKKRKAPKKGRWGKKK